MMQTKLRCCNLTISPRNPRLEFLVALDPAEVFLLSGGAFFRRQKSAGEMGGGGGSELRARVGQAITSFDCSND